ncbi:hypothetical protein CORC01_03682, partial [Colletotrichum orchidophilum]
CLQVRQLRQLTHLLDPRRPRRLTTLIGTCLRIGKKKVVMHIECLACPQKKTSRTDANWAAPWLLDCPARNPRPETPQNALGSDMGFCLIRIALFRNQFPKPPKNTLPMACEAGSTPR